jgi:Icc-related predicted phosphoesterase
VAGIKGTGGGFDATATPRTVTERSSGIVESTGSVHRLLPALRGLDTDVRIALTHYAPVADTLVGERPEIWQNLGTHLLGAVIDAGGAHLAVHGHAHRGTEHGRTAAGCPVRNVAQPVIRRPYALYTLSRAGALLPAGR